MTEVNDYGANAAAMARAGLKHILRIRQRERDLYPDDLDPAEQ